MRDKQVKTTEARPPRVPKRRWLWLIPAILAAAAVPVVLKLIPRSPASRVSALWSSRGVEKPNIILLTLDTTRADRLGCYGYREARTPVLDGLARRGVLFEQCATASPLTLPAHCSIMTGMYPNYHGVRVNGLAALGDEQTTIAEVLSGQGYRCGAFIAAFVLDGRWGLKQGFEEYDDRFDLKKYKHIDLGAVQRPGNEIMDSALAWLDGRRSGPFFAWIHLYDPHTPYDPPEPYRSEFAPRGSAGLYDGEIAFMDEQIGRLVAWLERSGLDQTTALILAGDHGEGLGSHGEATHGFFIYDYAVRVPLLVVAPFDEIRGRRVAAQSKLVDIFPTVLDLAGLESPAAVQGRSLLPLAFRPDSGDEVAAYGESMAPNVQFGWSPLYSLRTSRYKFIDAPRPELYDLGRDPGEENNIVQAAPELARRMKAELDRLAAETSRNAPAPQAANLDKETIERLTALGYIGAPLPARRSTGKAGALADPKDKIQIFESVLRSGELVNQEKYALAAEILESVIRGEPTIPQALLLLSTCYKELGRREEAQATLDAVLKENPEDIQALVALANILIEERKLDDVAALCRRTLSLDEDNVQALSLMGEIHVAKRESTLALPYFERAFELQPKLTLNGLSLAACLIELKQYDRAEPILQMIIKDNPKFPFAHFNLGLLYEEQGRWPEARAAYEDAVSIFPNEYKSRFNLGKTLLRLGDKAGYLEAMREVIRIAPDRPEGYLFLARGLLLEQSPLDDVRSNIDKGLALADTQELKALGYFLLADVYTRANQPDKVKAALEKANSFRSK